MDELTNNEQQPQEVEQQGEPAGSEVSQPEELHVPEIHAGDILEGKITQVNADHLLVDVGYKSDGMIPLTETTLAEDANLAEHYQTGDPVRVQVLSIDHQEGGLILSLRRAREAEAWQELEEAFASQEVLTNEVVEAVKGGLVVDVGLRAFMPASHIERGYVSDLSVYVGQPVRFRVIELDKNKNRVIISQKAILEEEHQLLREKTWESIEEGQVRKGVVKGITDFGAFVDLGGVDGLLHVSEMAWGRVNHPSEVVQVGDEIAVKILGLDREKEKISLGLKQTLPDPWDTAAQRYPEGGLVEGKVMRLAPFGAFVQLEPGIEGLVHISQMADRHVAEPNEVVQEGDKIKVKILRVQPQDRRISLSIKEANRSGTGAGAGRGEGRGGERQDRSGNKTNGGQTEGSGAGDAGSGITLGEMFGDLLEETRDKLNE